MKQPLFGIRISDLRGKKGLTQKELAEACNVDIRTIQRIESGDVLPRMHTVKLLAKALDVDINDFNGNIETENKDTNQILRLSFIAAIIFSINYILVVFQIIKRPFGFYIHELSILIHVVSCVLFFKGFYLLGKQSNNQALAASAFLSMVLIPILNIMDLFKDHFFVWGNISTVFTAVCINALILAIGFLMESSRKAYANIFYKIAGITTFVQAGLFLSLNFDLIAAGLIISIFCNVIMTYILYVEGMDVKKQWKGNVSPA